MKNHEGCRFIFTFKCKMVNSGKEGKLSITQDEPSDLHEARVDHEAKRLEVGIKVVKHYGAIILTFNEGEGPLILLNAAIRVVPDDENTGEK